VLQSNLQNFGGDKYLCKLGKEYLNASLCKYVVYSLQHSETFDVLHIFLPLTVAELSTLKQVHFFLAHSVHISRGFHWTQSTATVGFKINQRLECTASTCIINQHV